MHPFFLCSCRPPPHPLLTPAPPQNTHTHTHAPVHAHARTHTHLLQVADFNLSRQVEQGHLMSTLCITNPRWLGPEVLAGGLSDCASDVYAFGTGEHGAVFLSIRRFFGEGWRGYLLCA